MSSSEKWYTVLHGYDSIVETEGKEDDENFVADCGAGDEAYLLAKSIVADHNACLGIEAPETTVPELVEVARQVCIRTCVCHAAMRPYVPCEKCEARAVLAKTGQTLAASASGTAGT